MSPIRVITIEREYGSGGAEIARRIAARRGWKLWDQLLTNEIARLLQCDCGVVEEHEEKRDPLYYRLFKVRRLRASGKSEGEAIELAQTVDRDRAAFIQNYFGVEWPDRHYFHLMINSTMGEDTVAENILSAVARLDERKTEDLRSVLR
jgi:cytidylate kinase